jgi:hypothetical protein
LDPETPASEKQSLNSSQNPADQSRDWRLLNNSGLELLVGGPLMWSPPLSLVVQKAAKRLFKGLSSLRFLELFCTRDFLGVRSTASFVGSDWTYD